MINFALFGRLIKKRELTLHFGQSHFEGCVTKNSCSAARPSNSNTAPKLHIKENKKYFSKCESERVSENIMQIRNVHSFKYLQIYLY